MSARTLGTRQGIALAMLLLAATAFAWLGVIRSATAMRMPWMEPLSAVALVAFTLEWGVMMAAMMLPSAAPMIMLYSMGARRGSEPAERVIPAELFALTYVGLWLLTGIPIYLAWVGVGELSARSTTFAAAIPYAVAATLFAAGIYQLSAAKHACLRQCEAPADFLVRRWRTGYAASLRLAAVHAGYCIGCCWALMLVLVVAGAMSLPWVLGIALLVFAEKVLPLGGRTARITGVMLMLAGLAVAIHPALAAVLRLHGLHDAGF